MVDGEIGHDIALSPHVSGALELVRIIEYVVNKNIQNKMQLLTVTEERKQRKILQAAKRLRKKVQKFLNNVAASLDDVGGATGGATTTPKKQSPEQTTRSSTDDPTTHLNDISEQLYYSSMFEQTGDLPRARTAALRAYQLFFHNTSYSFQRQLGQSYEECEMLTSLVDTLSKLVRNTEVASKTARYILSQLARDGSKSEESESESTQKKINSDRDALDRYETRLTQVAGAVGADCALYLRTFLTSALHSSKSIQDQVSAANIHPATSTTSTTSTTTTTTQAAAPPDDEATEEKKGSSFYDFTTAIHAVAKTSSCALELQKSRDVHSVDKDGRTTSQILLGHDDVSLHPSEHSIQAGWGAPAMTASAEWKKFLQTHVSDERHIERVDATTMTREEFVDKYVTQGKPVMLTGLMRGWRATQRESTDDVHAGTSTAAAAAAAWSKHSLLKNFGTSIISVAPSSIVFGLQSFTASQEDEGRHWLREEITVASYVKSMEREINTKDDNKKRTQNMKRTKNTKNMKVKKILKKFLANFSRYYLYPFDRPLTFISVFLISSTFC